MGESSMRFARPALGVAIIGLAIAVAWHFRPAPKAAGDAENVVDGAPTSAGSSASVATPSPPVVEAPSDAASSRVEPVAPADASPATPAPAPLPGEAPVLAIAQLMQGRRDLPPDMVEGERKFVAEPVDATWAPGAEADVLGKLAQTPGLALTGLRVECRSTTCRMQLALPRTPGVASRSSPIDFEHAREFADSVGLEVGWMVGIVDDSGTLQSVTYLRRKGMAPDQPR
jgi:hypothetical protein